MWDNMWNIFFFSPLPPSPPILAGDKSIAIYDSFVAAARPLLPCLAVIRADSFRSVSLFKSCCNYTGFSICRQPDMIQSATTGESGAQRVNEKRDKAQWQEDQASKSEREWGDGGNEGWKETERERYGEQGRLIEQLRDEERAVGRRGGEEEIWFGK